MKRFPPLAGWPLQTSIVHVPKQTRSSSKASKNKSHHLRKANIHKKH